MKILHVLQSKLSLPARDYGGTERIVWGLLTAQQASGHEVRLLWGEILLDRRFLPSVSL